MDEEAKYAGAIGHFLNRDTGKVEKAMLYPVTRVELLGPDAQPKRVFVVNEQGEWTELV